jgi:hypothetical protein
LAKKLEWSMVDGAISRCQEKYKQCDISKGFPFFILELLLPNINEDLEELITDDGNDCGIDAVWVDTTKKDAHVHLFQFKHYKHFEKSDRYFPSREVDKVTNFLDRLFDQDEDLKTFSNPYLWDKVQEIWSVIRESRTKFTLYFCSNGLGLELNQKTRLENSLSKYSNICFEELTFAKILKLHVSPEKEETVFKISAIDKQFFDRTDGDIRGLITTVSAIDLINVIIDPTDDTRINDKIFDKNIRVYLGTQNTVNQSIIKSALSEKRGYFWYLNNGITAVCSSFSFQASTRAPIIEIRDLQIVNGAQTSNSLFEAYKKDPEAMKDVLLLVRLYETKNEHLPFEIAVATNSQTRISSRDLMSNNPIQVKLEKAFHGLGFFYERKKHQHQDKDEDKKIDAFKLGQTLLAYHLREPEKAKVESDNIFDDRHDEIFNSIHDIHYLLDVYQLYKDIEKMRHSVNLLKKRGGITQIDDFLSYGQFHLIYLVNLLAEKNGLSIGKTEERERLIHDALEVMRKFLQNRKNSAYYPLFRNPRTKHELLDITLQRGQLELSLA